MFCGAVALAALMAAPAAAGEPIFLSEDPTPTRSFSGSYTERGREHDGKKSGRQGYQDGYVAVYEDGVVACNGNDEPALVDQDGDGDGHAEAFQGYAWVGPNHAPEPGSDRVGVMGVNPAFPGDEEWVGAGSDHGKFSGKGTGEAPCEEADPEGDGAGQ